MENFQNSGPEYDLSKFFLLNLDLLCICNRKGTILKVNEMWRNVLGYSPAELENTRFLEYIHPDDLEDTVAASEASLKSKSVFSYTNRFRCMDGSYRYIEWRVQLFGDLLYSTARDVTDKKKGMAELEERYRAIVNSAPESVVIHKNGIIQFINKTGIITGGYRREEVIGHPLFEFLTEESRKIIQDAVKRGQRGAPVVDYEIEFRTKPGKILNMLIKTTPITYENEFALLTIMVDITDRAQMEKKLRESEMRLNLATIGAKIGLWDWDVETGGLFINEQCAEMIGYSTQELYPLHIEEWKTFLHEEDYLVLSSLLDKCFSGEIDYYECIIRTRHKSGEWIWVDTRSRVVERNEAGRPLRIVGIYLDVTRQKRGEEELELARKAAETANILKSQFLANMSHEIRTPMNGVLGFLNLLESTDLSREQREFIRDAKSSSDLLLYLINDILDLSRIESGRFTLEKIRFNLRTVIEDSLSIQTAKLKEKDIRIQVNVDPEIPEEMEGDPVRLRQILNNLIGNAVKFTENGEISISAAAIGINGEKATIEVRVKDTGIGIRQEHMEKLFQPFTQADASTTRKYGGSGLGLAISSHLAKMMEGEIRVESIPGEGSTFFLTFVACVCRRKENRDPEWTPEKTMPDREGPEVTYSGTEPSLAELGPRILLVEDNELNIKVFVKILNNAQLKCDVAKNGELALRAISEREYDIVFMDCQMPVMDGYECTARIRKMEPGQRHTSIVAMTANAMEGDRQACINAGMDDYMSKPVDIAQLFDMIRKYTRRESEKMAAFLEESLESFVRINGFDMEESRELYRIYLNSLPESLREMEELVSMPEFHKLNRLAHKLKGSSSTLRVQPAYDLFLRLEKSALNGYQEDCRQLIGQVMELFQI